MSLLRVCGFVRIVEMIDDDTKGTQTCGTEYCKL